MCHDIFCLSDCCYRCMSPTFGTSDYSDNFSSGSSQDGVIFAPHWKLTLPDKIAPNKKSEVLYPFLSIFEAKDVFVWGNDSIMMRADCDAGYTTKNSKYPRTELREMSADNFDKEASWNIKKGQKHILKYKGSIDHVPTAKPEIVFGQVHDGDDDVIQVRLENGMLQVHVEGEHQSVLIPEYKLGETMEITITAENKMILVQCKYQQKETCATAAPKQKKHLYFKVGCYTQSNPERGDGAGEYGQVTLHSAVIEHHI